MSSHQPDQQPDWTAFLADPAFRNHSPPSPAAPGKLAVEPVAATTPGASTASSADADSPGVHSDALSFREPAGTALTSLASSPSTSHFAAFNSLAGRVMDPNGSGNLNGEQQPPPLDHLAATYHSHQAALAYHAHYAAAAAALAVQQAGGDAQSHAASGTATPAPYPPLPGYPPLFAPSTSAAPFPTQLPPEWIAAANVAQAYSAAGPYPGYPSYPSPYPAASSAPSPALPTLPLPTFSHLGQVPQAQPLDPSLYALHMSLEAQVRAAAAGQAAAGTGTTGFELPALPTPGSSSVALPGAAAPHARSQTGPAAGAAAKRSSSYLKAAHGLAAAAHARSKTQPSQHSSPLASPSILPPADMYGFPSTSTAAASPAVQTHQRPLPPLPPSRGGGPVAGPSSVPHSPAIAQSPLSTSFTPASLYPAASVAFSPPGSTVPSPHPVVDYDFSSLEQDLDRFSSLGGFASAAAAAMASVNSPTSTGTSTLKAGAGMPSALPQRKPSDAYNVGGYGGSGTPRIAPDALPSPKVLTDVLNEPLFFPVPGSASASQNASPAASAGSAAAPPSAACGSARGSTPGALGSSPAASAASPAGSTIIDEEGAELLSRKDPIAAQVWRMFHKAKNTMPNGARMENLTWRLMSMTLRKRREDSAGSAGSGGALPGPSASVPASSAPSQAASPNGGDDARTRRALEEAIEEQREEQEERDTVPSLARGAPPGRMRGGRDRSDSNGARAMPPPAFMTAPQQQQKEEAEEDAEEERGRRRRTKSGTASKSNSASPAPEETDDAMDWRAMSKSRSRSRAPDMMDWRAASRSRSRAPDFRVAVAPPAIDSTPAIANFSRFFNDSGMPSLNEEMPPPPLPSTSSAPSSQPPPSLPTSLSSVPAPLDIPSLPPLPASTSDADALTQLANSLGLAPLDPSELFGSASARLDGHSLLDLPSPGAVASPPAPHSLSAVGSPTLQSPLSASPHPTTSFAFGAAGSQASGPDPNLAAIENTLNELISLQHLASPGTTPVPMPVLLPGGSAAGPSGGGSQSLSSSFQAAKSPANASFSPGIHTSAEPTPLASGTHSREQSLSASLPAKGSQAQQHLQQVISNRKASNLSASASSASSSRRASVTSSPYLNATSLAQNHRNNLPSFGTAASAAVNGASSSASGLSLARPAQLPVETSQPPTPYAEPPMPHFFPSSAPVQPAVFGSPNPPLFGNGTDTAHLLYDYFHAQHNSSPFLPSPYVAQQQLETFGSAPTGVDPSQLLNNSFSAAASPYGSDGSNWGISPHSTMESPAPGGTPEDDRAASAAGPSKVKRPTTMRANSAGSVPKAKSAPGSRAHSRSNTISLPSTIVEGQPLDLAADAEGDEGAAPVQQKRPPPKGMKRDPDGGPTKCLNCQTTNTPLWRRDAEGRPLCNACGLFRNLHGVDRPANLNTGVIKKRNRKSGPKDPTTKKSNSRAGGKRNSSSGAGVSASAKKERAGAGAPYPSAAARAAQDKAQQ
ncbi:hypothetical protein JCM10213_000495 [Rhodosporidiobolus nylandii]